MKTIIESNVESLFADQFSFQPYTTQTIVLKSGEYSAIQVALQHYLSSHAGVKND